MHHIYRFVLSVISVFSKGWGCKTTFSNKIVVQKSQFVFIGVKPYQVLKVMKEVHDNIVHSFHVVVSLANGIKISAFEEVIIFD